MFKRIFSIFKARNLEFFRDRSSLGWAFLFPFFIVLGFYFMNSGDAKLFNVGYTGAMPAEVKLKIESLKSINLLVVDKEISRKKISWQQLDIFIDFQTKEILFNEKSTKYPVLASALSFNDYQVSKLSDNAIRYVDWLFPGVIGMNMMFAALFGIGYVIVRYRKNGVLKRFNATPMSAFEFLSAQLVSRLFIVLFTSTVIYFGCGRILNLKTEGSHLLVIAIFICSALSLMSLGLLVASRIKSEEFAGGLLNMLTWPMMFLTGVWFNTDNFPPFLQKISQAIPLTQSISALRSVLLEGRGMADISGALIYNLVFALIIMTISSFLFKWTEE
jgi:ABC-2 type transport system permease protein